jgi:hypothetical protein
VVVGALALILLVAVRGLVVLEAVVMVVPLGREPLELQILEAVRAVTTLAALVL